MNRPEALLNFHRVEVHEWKSGQAGEGLSDVHRSSQEFTGVHRKLGGGRGLRFGGGAGAEKI